MQSGRAPRSPILGQRLVLLAAALGLYRGWQTFWFLTDDAYIAFRYVSNSVAGLGWVWNPPPFQPVEGYTSFLWVAILEVVWRVFGAIPPESANWLSLLCGYGSLYLTYRWVARLDLPPALDRHRGTLLALVLVGIVSNRTFLTWLSSGLETSLFNLLFLWWIYTGLAVQRSHGPAWLLTLAGTAGGTALARPDGYLVAAATLPLVAHHLLVTKRTRDMWFATPLLVIPAHVAWRRMTYGEWLPNTYYAKYIGAWPESGARYLLSFVLEYGIYIWLLILFAWLVTTVRRRTKAVRFGRDYFPAAITLMTVTAHAGYYTFMIGGDHFEFRVYSHLIPLFFVSALWLISRTTPSAMLAHAVLASFVLCSLPIPWVHWAETRNRTERSETFRGTWPIADSFPTPLRPAVALWDETQDWLIRRGVCARHQEHKIFHATQLEEWPSREVGMRYRWEDRIVLRRGAVGVPSWVLPHVAVIDEFGLNDRVIARTPLLRGSRYMAHERAPPPGYVRCFKPNLVVTGRGLRVKPRATPLNDADIRACEARDWSR
jgi:arabinofuranosyltransferase